MPSVIRRVLLIPLAVNLASCVPAPHVAHLRPAASGVVLHDGQPLPGIELFLGKHAGNNEPCAVAGERIAVSPDGSFAWPSAEEYHFTDSLIDPVAVRGAVTALCIRHPVQGVMIGAIIFMKQSGPVSLHLLCDTARPRGSADGGRHLVPALLGQARYCTTGTPPAGT